MLYITSIPDLVSLKDGINKLKITEKDTVAFVVDNGGSSVTIPYQSLSFLLTQVHPQRIEFFAKDNTAEMVSLGTLLAKFDKATVIGNPIQFPEGMKNIVKLGPVKKKPKKPAAPKTETTPEVKPAPAIKPAAEAKPVPTPKPAEKPAPSKVEKTEVKPTAGEPVKKVTKPATKVPSGATFLEYIGVNSNLFGDADAEAMAKASKILEDTINASKDYITFRKKIQEAFPDHSAVVFMKLDTSMDGIRAKLKGYKK